MYSVKILADSVNIAGNRLTTFELTYPRFIHSELLTHRMFSRNSASSRAIPVAKMIQRVVDDPVVPIRWGAAQKGMIAGEELTADDAQRAERIWLGARDLAVLAAKSLLEVGLHKTIPNRLLEPWMWITVICSATEWDNFWALRVSPQAEDHFRHLATMMLAAYGEHEPTLLQPGDWHLPLIQSDERDLPDGELRELSTARCARVSYLTHDGKRDHAEDYRLHNQLQESRHLSPFEHPAEALGEPRRIGNFIGWRQYRFSLEGAD